jgi:AraC-like DNA-binding protein
VQKPRLLWVDQTVSMKHAELPVAFTESCEIVICHNVNRIAEMVGSESINGVCFDMDYPDFNRLNLLRQTKINLPQVPIIFLTLQHSETLAVWSFRSRVLDYLVKPISRGELHRSLQTLRYVMDFRVNQRSRTLSNNVAPIPPEIPHTVRSDDVRLLPALYYVQQNFRFKVKNVTVSKLCGMSPFRFSRSFSEIYGITFQDYVVRYRILESCRLLKSPSANVTDVAYAIGFNDASYFSRTFRRHVGMTPSSYCSEIRNGTYDDQNTDLLRTVLELPNVRATGHLA